MSASAVTHGKVCQVSIDTFPTTGAFILHSSEPYAIILESLHVLKHLHALLSVALANLAQSLVLVPTLLHILNVELVHMALLAVVTSRRKLRRQ